MKKALTITLLMLITILVVKAQTAPTVIQTQTTIRIMINDSIAGWQYYFATDDKGHAPVLLTNKENVVTITTTKRNANGYIFAKNTDQTRQTNNYSFNLKGKPVFIVVAGNNGVIVMAKRYKIAKYSMLRNALPEAKRAAWN